MNVLVVAGVVCVLSWWLTGRLSTPGSLLYLLDHPNERSLHHVPTPRTGGVAVLASTVVGLGLIALMNRGGQEITASLAHSPGIGILLGMFVLAVVSFCDDRWGLPTGFRFGVQMVVALVLVIGSGLVLRSVWLPFGGNLQLGWVAWPVTVLFLVWMTNLYNFMDGMDGFAGGMTTLGFGCLAYLAWKGNHQFILVTALLVSLSSLGFLLHNFPPAKIFMGDVGSVSIGFLSASLIVLGCRDGVFPFWVPIIVFSPFIVDATITLVRRALRGKKVWEAHREHYYQRLVLSGWSHRRTVLAEYVVMVLCGILAVLYHQAVEGWLWIILGIWIVLFLGLARRIDRIQRNANEKTLS